VFVIFGGTRRTHVPQAHEASAKRQGGKFAKNLHVSRSQALEVKQRQRPFRYEPVASGPVSLRGVRMVAAKYEALRLPTTQG
jgi:GTP-dependent phosphoenolpyruvate carboxykinase